MWEVLRKHIEPINRERLKLLDEAERAAGANPVPLDKILDALLLPLMEAARTPQGLNQRLMQIVGRTFSESAEFCKELHREFFKNLSERFRAALRRALPDLSEKQLNWRFYLMICLMLGALSQHHRLEYLKSGNAEDDSALRQMRIIEQLADDEMSRLQFEKTLRKLSDTINQLRSQGHYGRSDEMLQKARDEIEGMPDSYWRTKLMDSLHRRLEFGYEGKPGIAEEAL